MDPITTAAIIGGGSALIGGASNAKAQSKANSANRKLAQDQMRWQASMSNTAYRRQAADLQAAGLNPILGVASSGASTGSAQMMEQQAVNPASGLEGAVNKATEAITLKREKEQFEEQKRMNKKQNDLTENQIMEIYERSQLTDAENEQTRMKNDIIRSELPAINEENKARIKEAKLRQAQSDFDKNWVKEDGYIKRANDVIQGAANVVDIIKPLSIKQKGNYNENSSQSYKRSQNYTDEIFDAQGEHRQTKSRRYHD